MTTPMGDQSAEQDQASAITDRMREEADAVRAAFGRLRADQDEAWKRYSTEVQSTLGQMQKDLEDARARLNAERATTRAELREELDDVFDKLRARFEDLRVQLRLGEMESSDAIGTVRAEALRLLDRGREAVRVARQSLVDTLS
ncbi:MAG: hypothetical protein WDA60_19555 [Acidimicrobiia bacterium]|jgi:hypothetical protein